MTIFALRFIIPGVFITIFGLAMLSSEETFHIGWRLVIAGPLCVGLGTYFLIRDRSEPPTEEDDA